MLAHGAVEGEQVGSQEMPEGRKGHRTIGEVGTNRSNERELTKKQRGKTSLEVD